MKNQWILFLVTTFLWTACEQDTGNTSTATPQTAEQKTTALSPDLRYGALFEAVQMARIFPDSKTFADCTPKFETAEILSKYKEQQVVEGFDLQDFVKTNFDMPKQYASGFRSDTSRTAAQHINALWDVLTRDADEATKGTLIALPKPYLVPGGRFGEIYYWDSYFTILGLETAGKTEMITNMADNFSHLIETVGHIPNGNRTYYLSRSQPPFYSAIIDVLATNNEEEVLKKYLPFLQKEYDFWMDGAESLNENKTSHRRVVRLPDGNIMNRYWDDSSTPRPESYAEDVILAKENTRPKEEVYLNLKAACESGWDFSSRWFADGKNLSSIRTTEIIPVDLNALIYHLEMMLEKAYRISNKKKMANEYLAKANQRKANLIRYCWDEASGFFMDYDFVNTKTTDIQSLAGVYPLYFGMATEVQAQQTAVTIREKFLKKGGVVTTLTDTKQQWDAPNGWAPLQWMTVKGLRNYGHYRLANEIKTRWIRLNLKVYQNTGKMVEKYNVMDMTLDAGGGEYPVQDGFGWTNGILLKLLSED